MKNSFPTGIDIGSTTAKMVIFDGGNNMVFSRYRCHHAMIHDTLHMMFEEAQQLLGHAALDMAFTGSVGMGIAEADGFPFIQEVVSSAKYVRHEYPDVRTVIEIGGEDSKVILFDDEFYPDIRMNGSCAGGTGAFIEQMAVLLDVPLADLDKLAGESKNIYTVASRCGVFAKTDVQALLSSQVSKADVVASVFHAVALQTIAALTRGSRIEKKVLFAGGPMTFFPNLRKAFVNILSLEPSRDIVSCHAPELIPAMGAALFHDDVYTVNLASCTDHFKKTSSIGVRRSNSLPPLFRDDAERRHWQEKYKQYTVERVSPRDLSGKSCFLGIDSGSTTTKMALIDDRKRISLSYYTSNDGDSLQAVRKGLNFFYTECLSACGAQAGKGADVMPKIARAAVTGYGEGLIKAAFGIDDGVVETIAHYRAARHFNEKVSFILDIGGQDMKAIFVRDGFVSDIQLNEACSSGCGSFIETLARSLGYSVDEFSVLACQADAPYDLGTRCTVFMNSKIKQALREGVAVRDIAAGIAYSVIKNALYKVLKLSDTKVLGDVIVAQGGTFKNHAVLRCLELLLGKEAIRADVSELMGAYGAALTAYSNYMENQAQESKFKGLRADNEVKISRRRFLDCKGCENRCCVTELKFGNGRHYFYGNRCERYFSNGEASEKAGENLIKLKEKRLFDRPMAPEGTPILTFGIPRALNIYENFPFWRAFLVSCGFKVAASDPSSMKLFEKGMATIMSENICLPAKLAHGHILNLVEKGVDRIFYPVVVYEQKEHAHVQNSYNCPIITGYPDVLESAVDPEDAYGIPIDKPVIDFRNTALLRKQLYHFVKPYGVGMKSVDRALCLAINAQKEFKKSVRDEAERIIKEAQGKDSIVFVLAGRPYHVDPFINHGIPELLAQLGVDVISEDAIPFDGQMPSADYNILSQWAYVNRILEAAEYVSRNPRMEMVQMTSFGCGLDAISADEVRDILSRAGKIYAQIKMDEITALGATKIRLRTMLETIKEKSLFDCHHENQPDKRLSSPSGKDGQQTIIVPCVSSLYSPLISFSFSALGYKVESLAPQDRSSVDVGLKYVNNDMCYPAVIVIGDIIKAFQSGKYDPQNTAVMLTQTFGQCRASNYLPLTKKALVRAGFGDVPVLSISADDTEVAANFNIDRRELVKRLALGVVFGEALARMYYATAAYEVNPGDALQIQKRYMTDMEPLFVEGKFKCFIEMLKCAVRDFNRVKTHNKMAPVIGVVGEIFVKYNSFANSHIVEWLMQQGVEVVIPPLPAFFTQRFANEEFNQRVYLKRSLKDMISNRISERYANYYLLQVEKVMGDFNYYRKNRGIKTLALSASRATSLANQAGEGWLLTGEMIAMLESGISNIICLQPFGCLANHITGKGMEKRVKKLYPEANILFLDMDAGASEVNHLNRLHFMLMMVREKMAGENQRTKYAVARF